MEERPFVSSRNGWYGRLSGRGSAQDNYGGFVRLEAICDTTEVDRVNVRFTPAPKLAEGTVDVSDIWGEPIIFKDIPVKGEQ
jgi:hypothetical protein